MTLLLAAVNAAHAFLLSDRQLTVMGRSQCYAATKEGFIDCSDGRLLYAYIGLAACRGFQTSRWLLDGFMKIGESKCEMQDIIEGAQDRASHDFQSLSALRDLSLTDKRLSVVFLGYHNSGSFVFAEISNTTDDNGCFSDEARDEFGRRVRITRPLRSGYLVSWHGCIAAAQPSDFLPLTELLEANRPSRAIMGKAVDLMRSIARRPQSRGMIGQDIVSGRIEPTIGGRPTAGNFPLSPTSSLHLLDMAFVRPGGIAFAVSEASLKLRDGTLVDPATPRGQTCPCGSGKRFKYCHGRKPKTKSHREVSGNMRLNSRLHP
jgi:hypothetical protein